jgi:monothiol glutaredoxin
MEDNKSTEIIEKIKKQISENEIVLYMKGDPEQPECGFSAQVVKIILGYSVPFAYVNILDNLEIRQALPKFSEWPTFPQLFVKGELVGGCDIITQMHESNELKAVFDSAK